MVHILVQCKVRDLPRWKESFDLLFAARQRAGEMGCRLFHDGDHAGELVILFDWESKKDARAFFESEQWASEMRKAGIVESPRVVYLEDVRALHLSPAD